MSHGFSKTALYDNEILFESLSIFTILNLICWETERILLGFIFLFDHLFYFRNQVEHENKVSLAKSFGAGIAHEMRNPLSGLLTSINAIQSILTCPKNSDIRGRYTLSTQELKQLHDVGNEAMEIIQSGNETIDLLLTSIDENRVSRSILIN